jgi:hypothetical protein
VRAGQGGTRYQVDSTMALPKRNRRKISVNDLGFHWVKGARGDNGRSVACVQLDSGTGSKLMIDPFGPIVFDMIPDAIRFAMEHGWLPKCDGPDFWIAYNCTLDEQSQFVLRSPKDPPFWNDPNRKEVIASLRRSGHIQTSEGEHLGS